jgi:hypothetical protein
LAAEIERAAGGTTNMTNESEQKARPTNANRTPSGTTYEAVDGIRINDITHYRLRNVIRADGSLLARSVAVYLVRLEGAATWNRNRRIFRATVQPLGRETFVHDGESPSDLTDTDIVCAALDAFDAGDRARRTT